MSIKCIFKVNIVIRPGIEIFFEKYGYPAYRGKSRHFRKKLGLLCSNFTAY